MSGHEKSCEQARRYTTMLQLPRLLMLLVALALAVSAAFFLRTPALVDCSVLFALVTMHLRPIIKDNQRNTILKKKHSRAIGTMCSLVMWSAHVQSPLHHQTSVWPNVFDHSGDHFKYLIKIIGGTLCHMCLILSVSPGAGALCASFWKPFLMLITQEK